MLSLDGCPISFTAPKLQDFLACVQPGEPSLPASARTYATRARQHLGRSSDRNTTKLLSETRYEPLNRFALATEKHFPRSFTRPTLGGDLNSYKISYQPCADKPKDYEQLCLGFWEQSIDTPVPWHENFATMCWRYGAEGSLS